MLPTKEERRQPPAFDWTFWFRWVLVSTLGWLIGLFLPQEAAPALGGAMGLLQWLVLRRLIPEAGWWILATTLGWAGGYLLTLYVLPAEIIVLQGILIGLIIGVMQWLALQRWVRRAGWWLLVSALAWAIGPILGPTLTGGVIGAVTGFALELLTRPLRIADTAEDEETRPSVR